MNRIREVANKKKIKIQQIIIETGISKSAIYKVMNGNYEPSVSNALKIARALDTSVEELFD
jgi:transcriptional regulator with XRE-family HTH domain